MTVINKNNLITFPLREANSNQSEMSENDILIKKCDELDLWVKEYIEADGVSYE